MPNFVHMINLAIDLRQTHAYSPSLASFQADLASQWSQTEGRILLLSNHPESLQSLFYQDQIQELAGWEDGWLRRTAANRFQLPKLLNEKKIDAIIGFNSFPNKLRVPEFVFLNDRSPFKKLRKNPKSQLNRTFISTLPGSPTDELDIPPENLIQIPGFYPRETRMLTENEQDMIREKYTGSRSYFLYIPALGADADLVPVLKAYSAFKRWSQSGFRLVIFADDAYSLSHPAKLESYKYREDVILIENPDSGTRNAILSSALVWILDPDCAGYGSYWAAAGEYRKPVLAPFGQDPEHSTDTRDIKILGDQLNRIYGSEQYRNLMIPAPPDEIQVARSRFLTEIKNRVGSN